MPRLVSRWGFLFLDFGVGILHARKMLRDAFYAYFEVKFNHLAPPYTWLEIPNPFLFTPGSSSLTLAHMRGVASMLLPSDPSKAALVDVEEIFDLIFQHAVDAGMLREAATITMANGANPPNSLDWNSVMWTVSSAALAAMAHFKIPAPPQQRSLPLPFSDLEAQQIGAEAPVVLTEDGMKDLDAGPHVKQVNYSPRTVVSRCYNCGKPPGVGRPCQDGCYYPEVAHG